MLVTRERSVSGPDAYTSEGSRGGADQRPLHHVCILAMSYATPRTHLTTFRAAEPLATASQPAPDSLFAAHGVWAPGVRLMRNISFAYKALFICALFIVPLALSLYFFVASQSDQIQFAKTERDGVAVIARLSTVQADLLSIRNVTRASLGGAGCVQPLRHGPHRSRRQSGSA